MNGMKNSVYSPLEQYCKNLGQNILEIPILLERLSVYVQFGAIMEG